MRQTVCYTWFNSEDRNKKGTHKINYRQDKIGIGNKI